MLELHKTYGKTIHTWCGLQISSDYSRTCDTGYGVELMQREFDKHPDFPIGPPHSMMSYTADGQVDQDALDERDR